MPVVPAVAAPVPLFTPLLLVPAAPTEPVGPAGPAAPLTPPGEMLPLEVPVPGAPKLPGGQSVLIPRLPLVLGDVVPVTVPVVLGKQGAPVTPRLLELVAVPVALELVPAAAPA